MPPRSPRRRLASAILALWFAFLSAAPSSWRPCPEHGPAGEVGHGVGHAGHPGMTEPATGDPGPSAAAAASDCGHGQPGAPQPAAPRRAPSHPCDCPPACAMVSAVARVDVPVALPPCTVRALTESPARYVERTAPSRAWLLPFANGPPAVLGL
ncbi:MAG: hypothetical protein FJ363_08585 [Gemmatimonadetes bacterium]|nr:hypothetical protein [Gemmatimonadota bacterium]